MLRPWNRTAAQTMEASLTERKTPQPSSNERPAGSDPAFRTSLEESQDFERLYKEYRARVYSLCLCMTANRDDAEDLTQETFFRLLTKLDTFRGESSFYAWLRRVAINVVLLRFQKAYWRRETSLDEMAESSPVDAPSATEIGAADPALLETPNRIDLERAIDQLPAGSKAVLLLHDLEGFQHDEISKQMGCTCGTSKSQLHKARLKVREMLQETYGGRARQDGFAQGEFYVTYSPVPQA